MDIVVANRGEIAVRIVRTARERGYRTHVLHTGEESESAAARLADEAVRLPGEGAGAYLDVDAVVTAARGAGAGAFVHPGYGFLSESADLARACAEAGLTFVGPDPAVLRTFGDKVAARAAAEKAGVPVLPATRAAGPDDIAALLAAHPGGVMVKAAAGGGGRGMRRVFAADEVAEAYERCRSEARNAFGDATVYAEALIADARHVEVQIIADGTRAVALGDRDCSVQRRHQKLIEVAPAPALEPALRERLHRDAVRIAESVGCRGVVTVEFLVAGADGWFLEVNPRLQVEHTVTEEITGTDLVGIQFDLALGRTLAELDLGHPARGYAVQARINAELVSVAGDLLPTSGTITRFGPPTGAGVRVDTAIQAGMRHGTRFDSLLAKVIARGPSLDSAMRRCRDALAETTIAGVDTNIALLRAILDTLDGPVSTGWFERATGELLTRAADYASSTASDQQSEVLDLGVDEWVVRSPMGATVVSVAAPGSVLPAGAEVAVLEAMKMQHVVRAEGPLRVQRPAVAPGEVVDPHAALLIVTDADHDGTDEQAAVIDLDRVRDDLAEVRLRHDSLSDDARPDAVAKRHRLGRRTARKNIADLVDADSFVEYGGLAIAAQTRRRSTEDLIANTPADGLVAGIATINAARFGHQKSRAVVMSYDYTVLAGTQGMRNHAKTDRMLELAHERELPVVFFTEGGGGRPGDTDYAGVSGLDVTTFRAMGALSGRVPLIGIVSGRCFAGNAALLGMCDVVIATPDANIGMGGPAMIEGGGLGVYRPEDIGPIEVQRRNGVVHIAAADEAEAVALARQYLAYFQGAVDEWEAPDPRLSRHVVPEDRLRAFDIRAAIAAIADLGSVLELRRDWGTGMVTALMRVEGRPFGVIANDCHHLGGAIDAPAADKLSAFLRLCGTHGLPIVSLCDTPGFMVGPDIEKEGVVTRFARLFIDAAALTVPFGTIILRKGYGLGAQAMAAGSFRAPRFVVAWPTGEIGGMGLEGAVRLGFAKELAAIEDPEQRRETFDNLVELAYANGKALNAATLLELDDVIDPADTRRWISTL
ncbi:acetyl-CoA carboxylase family protein [Nocardia cyriacigeorgica]|uniref:acetyl-CoA carboxylase family protein n=1 Tax=Nocardia cyriacigeorgica TaxID=135487 RepID=UPI001894C9F7|nr:carboxyl transferase domain-containing protein [Nocardia cyriacigeorgica]MBF6162084.1 ATP-grasp domain-containing protein [Nocardia cyriacigeorgica]MBF6200854.1 ATP-grasp domain-containing protein [Nocardia cyriacigeorgica]